MLVGHYTDKTPEPQTKAGTDKTVLRTLIYRDEGARVFSLRVITIDPGGHIGLHSHSWEHEIFVFHGTGIARTPDVEKEINPGDYVWIPPDEVHGFDNTGDTPLEFVCCIPIKSGSGG